MSRYDPIKDLAMLDIISFYIQSPNIKRPIARGGPSSQVKQYIITRPSPMVFILHIHAGVFHCVMTTVKALNSGSGKLFAYAELNQLKQPL